MPIKIVHELRMASGRNAKLDILRRHKNNTLWKNILVAMYDSSINYYVSAPADNTFVESNCDNLFSDLIALSTRQITGNTARAAALKGSKKHGEIFRLILKGSLNCGVSIRSINAVYPCLIPTFDVMLANKDKPTKFPVWSSIKYDGVRIVVTVDNSQVTIQTRNGKILNILSLKKSMAKQTDGVYDGELVMGDGLQVSRTRITGEVNRVLKGTSIDIEGYTFCIFDKVSLDDWYRKKCTTDFFSRLLELNDQIIPDISIRIIRQNELNNQSDIESLFRDKLAMGYEGLILRYMHDPYIWDRGSALMKVKSIITATLVCSDTTEGRGKYEGMIGALLCHGTIDDKSIVVHVGTGLSDYDRDLPEEAYIGCKIEVEYNDIVQAEGADHWSLFLPVFKRIVGGV